jgi:hypothetical protein
MLWTSFAVLMTGTACGSAVGAAEVWLGNFDASAGAPASVGVTCAGEALAPVCVWAAATTD